LSKVGSFWQFCSLFWQFKSDVIILTDPRLLLERIKGEQNDSQIPPQIDSLVRCAAKHLCRSDTGLAADRSLDPSFGTGGKMITNFGPMMTWAMTSLCNRGESRA
jgi:hypothetical protein